MKRAAKSVSTRRFPRRCTFSPRTALVLIVSRAFALWFAFKARRNALTGRPEEHEVLPRSAGAIG